MENDESFKPEINLQEFSVVAEAIRYWESPIIRKKIRQLVSPNNFNGVHGGRITHQHIAPTIYTFFCPITPSPPHIYKWKGDMVICSLTRDVLRQLEDARLPESLTTLGLCSNKFDATHLPPPIKIKIRNAIPFIGKEIIYWIRYVTSDLKLGLQYTEKMYWTNYGTIDEAKTFQLYWQNNSNLLSEQGIGLPALYSVACINCQEAFVSDNLKYMREILQNYCGSLLNVPIDVGVHSLLSIWICCYVKKSKEEGCELYRNVRQSNDSDAKLFSICVTEGFVNGVKYFGNRLKSGRDRLFKRHAVLTLRELLSQIKKRILSGKRNNFIEIIIFLIKEMIPETRSLYLFRNLKNLFEILIEAWPHNKSFLFQILTCSFPDMQESDQENILTTIFSYLKWDRSLREILGTILKQAPAELKNKMIIERAGNFFKKLIYDADFQTIELILNDPYVSMHRHEIVTKKIVEALHPDYVMGLNFDFLQKFTEEYLTGDEKNEFKYNFIKVNNFREVLTEGNLDLCKELIRWRAQSQEELKNFKSRINAKDVFLNAVSKKYVKPFLSIAEELLNWQFDDDKEQIKAFKERMRSEVPMTDDFIREHFYNLWDFSQYFGAGSLCYNFFNFIFDGDEAKIFIKEKIIGDENFLKRLTPVTLERLYDLLRFCDFTLADVIKLKREKLKEIDSSILYFAIERSQFIITNDLLNWLVADEKEKKDIIGNFLNSENGIELCCKLLGPSISNNLESALIFLNSWLKPHGNTSELLSKMTERLETAEVSKVTELFRKLEESDYLTWSDLEDKLNEHDNWMTRNFGFFKDLDESED